MFISIAHTRKNIDTTFAAFGEALVVVKQALAEDNVLAYLEGAVIELVIRPPVKSKNHKGY